MAREAFNGSIEATSNRAGIASNGSACDGPHARNQPSISKVALRAQPKGRRPSHARARKQVSPAIRLVAGRKQGQPKRLTKHHRPKDGRRSHETTNVPTDLHPFRQVNPSIARHTGGGHHASSPSSSSSSSSSFYPPSFSTLRPTTHLPHPPKLCHQPNVPATPLLQSPPVPNWFPTRSQLVPSSALAPTIPSPTCSLSVARPRDEAHRQNRNPSDRIPPAPP